MAVGGVGVECDVGDNTHTGQRVFDLCYGAANKIFGVEGLLAVHVFFLYGNDRKKGGNLNAIIIGTPKRFYRKVDAAPFNVGHGFYRLGGVFSL